MWLFYRTDAMSGLTLGWLSAIQTFPINILSYIAFCLLLLGSTKLFTIQSLKKGTMLMKKRLCENNV